MINKVIRLYYTLKPLKFQQVFYRIYYRLLPLKKIRSKKYDLNHQSWVWDGPEVANPSYLGGTQVIFLNSIARIDTSSDWNSTQQDKLWLYNLHYFDDLNALDNSNRAEQHMLFVKRWIEENPPCLGNGWEPYPISLRLVNWVKWYNRTQIADPIILSSIRTQADALLKQLEYHILGNHLFANAKALVFVGTFFEGYESDIYLTKGLSILDKEIPEQFLSDGGHFELSPMYHCILLWDLLDLLKLAKLTKNSRLLERSIEWEKYAIRAIEWLRAMVHPDGEVSFFNDSAFGIAASPKDIFAYAESLGLTSTVKPLTGVVTLKSSGYTRIEQPKHLVLFDHAAVGPDYLPGHAHADTLSTEWSVGSCRVLVNSGTSIYGVSTERLRQRQTAAHNTVEVDGFDSSEVWSGFRVARRARASLESVIKYDGRIEITASHDGYKRLPNKVLHARTLNVSERKLEVIDKVTGAFNQANIHWHLEPKVKVVETFADGLCLKLDNGQRIRFTTDTPFSIRDATWHPEFGVSIASTKILMCMMSAQAVSRFEIV